jgi:hypothetical protein
MWLEKLTQGMLRVLTPLGPRYVNPSFWQRLYLLWLFRNFHTLPVKVLSVRQQRRLEQICRQHSFVSLTVAEPTILGTLEQRPAVEETHPPRRPSQGVSDAVAPFAADLQQRS